jgi:hypothetical protein
MMGWFKIWGGAEEKTIFAPIKLDLEKECQEEYQEKENGYSRCTSKRPAALKAYRFFPSELEAFIHQFQAKN